MHDRSISKEQFSKRLRPSLLYVDDNQPMLDIIQSILERESFFKVLTCFCPYTAHQVIKKHHQDIILSDYDMPGMNGIELLHQIRSEGIHVPFILYTAYNRVEIDEDISNMDSFYFVPKLGSIEKEISQIKSVIQNSLIHINQNSSFL